MKQMGHAFTEKQVDSIFLQILSALKFIHQQGLYHLDLKPDNIMHNDEGHCWLIDFGASKQLSYEQSMTMATTTGLCYTPGYAPSEQVSCNTKRIGPWTDFYSLGATLYNLLTNLVPPSPDDILVDGKKAFHFPNDISASMRNMVIWLMNIKPQDRPQSVEEIEKMLSSHTSTTTPIKGIAKKKDRIKNDVKKKQTRWIVPLTLATAGILAGVAITFFVLKDDSTLTEPVIDANILISEIPEFIEDSIVSDSMGPETYQKVPHKAKTTVQKRNKASYPSAAKKPVKQGSKQHRNILEMAIPEGPEPNAKQQEINAKFE